MTRLFAPSRACLVLGLAVLGSGACASPDPVTRTAPAWASGATCYEIFVRSFNDSDGDGIGDFRGLTARLDYLNDGDSRTSADLGVKCLWLMPVAESPGYHGYDVSDYYQVEQDYGTAEDFKEFVAAAHKRGMVVLVDMVLNHLSSEHASFQRALADPAAPERRLFRFQSQKGPLNKWGGDNWHKSPLRDEYYYGFFWQGMPDLDYENADALEEMKKVATFWLTEMDVDGFRLDAVKFLVEEGTQADDTPGTHRVLRDYQAHLMRTKPGVYTVGEVFDSTASLLTYYPDQLDGYFAFEVGDSIIVGVREGRGSGILAPALRLQDTLPAWRWSPFLRNHDQPRTMTELGGDIAKAKVAAVLQLTMPGLPFVYYGEEVGMSGPKPDELIRTPFAFSLGGAHGGFTRGTPWQPLAADSLSANVEAQWSDPHSLLSLYRRLIFLRQSLPALAEGTLIPLATNDRAIVAYARRAGDAFALIVVNVGPSSKAPLIIFAEQGTLPIGRVTLTDQLGMVAPLAVDVTIREQGTSSFSPLPVIPAHTALILSAASPSRR